MPAKLQNHNYMWMILFSVHAKTKNEAAAVFSVAMIPVSHRVQDSCLHFNMKKQSVCLSLDQQCSNICVGQWRDMRYG